MCTVGCLMFGIRHLRPEEVEGRDVIEVGACEVVGSLRPVVESWRPRSYLGVDIVAGNGVDEICDAEDLLGRYGAERFDIVISTEMIEHTRNWRKVVSNLKHLCRQGGILLVTTRSRGFHYHAYPHDFWRYEADDIREIFADFTIERIETDPRDPGVFVKAVRPLRFVEKDLSGYPLYSVVTGRSAVEIGERDFRSCHFRKIRYKIRKKEIKKTMKTRLRSWFSSSG
ncbi:MAG TPA: methyltransferase domain-containing protein [Candidatus Aquicultoraceae bacterium]|nr:methyltransferase domain-containing protein [Candidatus Aquicultoraceae bacterium]